MKEIPPGRSTSVEFTFLSLEGVDVEIGEAVLRKDEMVLDVPASRELPACLIRGHRTGHIWRGFNASKDDDASEIKASWTEIDGTYVGVWIEDGEEFLFSFRMPK